MSRVVSNRQTRQAQCWQPLRPLQVHRSNNNLGSVMYVSAMIICAQQYAMCRCMRNVHDSSNTFLRDFVGRSRQQHEALLATQHTYINPTSTAPMHKIPPAQNPTCWCWCFQPIRHHQPLQLLQRRQQLQRCSRQICYFQSQTASCQQPPLLVILLLLPNTPFCF